MAGFLTHFRADLHRKQNAFGRIAAVCLILLALLVVVQVAHLHPFGTDADHCPLCIVMHTAAPVAAASAVVVLVQMQNNATIFQAQAVVRHWHPKLFTRPPPAGC